MIHALLLTALVTGSADDYPMSRVRESFRVRGRDALGFAYAYFEAFPTSGAGTSGACSTTAPTGARGEALTFTRASSATCTKTATGGLATTGIADGDLVSLSSNVARVEYDSAGTLGLLVEAAGTNVILQSAAIAGLPWADVGTPAATSGATDPFNGTSGVTITDDDGAAFEGRSQLVVVVATSAYFMHCYVKAGTLAKARISIDGTTQDIAGLSATTWSIIEKGDASASGAAVTVQVLAGNATTDTGSVIFGGCDAKLGTYRTSYVATAGVAVTRAVDSASFAGLSISSAAGLSWAASVQHPSANGGAVWGASTGLVQDATNRTQLYRANTNVQTCDYLSTAGNRTAGGVIATYVAGQLYRQACSYSGPGAASVLTSYRDGVSTGASAAGTTGAITATSVIPCALGAAATTAPADGICSRICVDPDPTRCR